MHSESCHRRFLCPMHRYWRIDFRALHTSCWFQMGTLLLQRVESGQKSWLFVAQTHLFWWGHIRTHRQRSVSKILILACIVWMIFCVIFRIPFFSPTQCWKLNPTVKQAIVLIWNPSDDLHYNGWMARSCQKSKAGNAAYCSCNWPYDEVMSRYVYLPESSIHNAYLPWNSTIDIKYSHIWSRRYIYPNISNPSLLVNKFHGCNPAHDFMKAKALQALNNASIRIECMKMHLQAWDVGSFPKQLFWNGMSWIWMLTSIFVCT